MQERHLSKTSLTALQRREIVLKLHEEGAFRAKNAASYVGHVLNIARATVYKYLSEMKP